MQQALQLDTGEALEAELSGMSPDGHGLTVLPFWAGERSPGWVGEALGTIHGLTLATTSTEILQAGLESVAYRINLVWKLLQPRLAGDVQIIASGGALNHSPAWVQIITDVIGRPLDTVHITETSGRGSTLLALEALGALADLAEAPIPINRRYTPDPKRHQRYQQAMERQQALYQKLVGNFS